jgi:hypothetical protein
MPHFRKKPVVIEAMQFKGHEIDGVDYALAFDEWIGEKQGSRQCRYVGQSLIIPTLEGDHEAKPGDWIIQGVQGELYPCKPDIFAATYEPVDTA